MANVNVAFGLKRSILRVTPATQGTNTYFIGSSAARSQGSMVKADNGGSIVISVLLPEILRLPLGVFAGCEYVSSSTGKKVFSNFGPVRADTNFDISALCMTTQCSGSSFVQTLRLQMRRLRVLLF